MLSTKSALLFACLVVVGCGGSGEADPGAPDSGTDVADAAPDGGSAAVSEWTVTSDPTLGDSDTPNALAATDSVVYVVGSIENNTHGRIEKRSSEDGALVAAFGDGGVVTLEDQVPTNVAVRGSEVFVAGGDFVLRLDAETGQESWSVNPDNLEISSLAAGQSGVFVAGAFGSESNVHLLNAETGLPNPSFSGDGVETLSVSSLGEFHPTVAVADDTLYALVNAETGPGPFDQEWWYMARDEGNGALAWEYEIFGPTPAHTSKGRIHADSAGVVIEASSTLWAASANGEERNEFTASEAGLSFAKSALTSTHVAVLAQNSLVGTSEQALALWRRSDLMPDLDFGEDGIESLFPSTGHLSRAIATTDDYAVVAFSQSVNSGGSQWLIRTIALP